VLEIMGKDRYVSRIPYSELRNTKAGQPIAYLAIEDPQQKWPALRKKCDTAGPFYLVWLNPGGPSLDSHAWPYCIETITVTAATEDALVLPDPALDARSPERLGYEVYRQHCSTCHAMNGAGPERMGPDLNQPMSPTEYLRDEILRQLIRDPSSVRKIPDSSMVGVPSLTDAELDQLLAYFRHMARRRSPL
jgi:mono/diheme cytochrome c family protein